MYANNNDCKDCLNGSLILVIDITLTDLFPAMAQIKTEFLRDDCLLIVG